MGAYIAGLMFGMVMYVVVGGLIGAILLRAAASLAMKLEVPFGQAFVTYLVCAVCNSVVGVIGVAFGFLMVAASGNPAGMLFAHVLILALSFIISAGIIGVMLKVGFGAGAKITLFMYLIVMAIALVIVGAIMLVTAIR